MTLLEKLCAFYFAFSVLVCAPAGAQSLVEMLQGDARGDSSGMETVKENIKIIGNSQKIFILTNQSKILGQGDFVTVLLKNRPVARALVAKKTEQRLAIKMIKVYSLKRWNLLRKGLELELLRGDDSILFAPKPKEELVVQADSEESEAPADVLIKDEQDLYDEKLVVDDLSFTDEEKRKIKTDNLVSVNYGLFAAQDFNGDSKRYAQFAGSWAYQFADDFYFEGLYGRSNLDQFPAPDINSAANNLTVRFKYVFKAPFYSFFLPYIGYQVVSIDSPDAGVGGVNPQREIDLVDEAASRGPIFGVTILRRFVPGWFFKVDLGTDIISAGVAIEF